jgi:hypothetical protein
MVVVHEVLNLYHYFNDDACAEEPCREHSAGLAQNWTSTATTTTTTEETSMKANGNHCTELTTSHGCHGTDTTAK